MAPRGRDSCRILASGEPIGISHDVALRDDAAQENEMRRSVCILAVSAAACVVPAAARAQTPTGAPPAAAPVVNLWYAGGTIGASAVQNVSVVGGVEAGMRVAHNLDAFVEVGRAHDVVTRRLDSKAETIATWLGQTQGKTAGGTIAVPATLGAIGVRYVLESPRMWRPYAVFEVGLARLTYRPAFTLAGSDITPSIASYGVTLGSDLRGSETKGTIGGGIGVLVPFGKLYFDGSYRLTSIRATGQAINVSRLQFGVGYRF
jgi:hypothetical protein